MEKKYNIELTKEELCTLQTAMHNMWREYAAARDAEIDKADKNPSKSETQHEMRERYIARLGCKKLECKLLLNKLFDAEEESK